MDDRDARIRELEIENARLRGEVVGLRQALPVPWTPVYPLSPQPGTPTITWDTTTTTTTF